jgi:hypothetical protein
MGKGSTQLLAMAAMMAVTGALVERNPFRGMIGTVVDGPSSSYKSIRHNKRRRGRKPK